MPTATGTYPLQLWVKDRYGCEDSIIHTIKILPNPQAGFSITDSSVSCHQIAYTFTDTSQFSTKSTYTVNGNKNYDLTAGGISFTSDGHYRLIQTVTNGYCEDSTYHDFYITLRPRPIAAFQVLSDSVGCAPMNTILKNQSKNSDSFSVNYGDENIVEYTGLDTFSHAYTIPGSYALYLTAFSKEGCEVESRKIIITVYDSLSARIHVDKQLGCSPLTVNFSNVGHEPPGMKVNYFWQTNNGLSSTDREPKFIFNSDKDTTFIISLYLKGGSCTATDSLRIQVRSFNPTSDYTQMRGATVESNSHILIRWDSLAGATKYLLERRSENGIFQPISTSSDNFYRDGKVNLNLSYQYRVTALDARNNAAATSLLATSIVLKAEKTNMDTAAQLEWNAYQQFPKGVLTYRVERQQFDGSWMKLDSQLTLSYLDGNFSATSEGNRCYRITAVEQRDSEAFLSLSNEQCLVIPLNVYVPNAFTPNGDGFNDTLLIKGTGITSYYLQIYNRWGERIFTSDSITHSLDGRDFPDGVYHYILYASGKQRNLFLKGNITLMK